MIAQTFPNECGLQYSITRNRLQLTGLFGLQLSDMMLPSCECKSIESTSIYIYKLRCNKPEWERLAF